MGKGKLITNDEYQSQRLLEIAECPPKTRKKHPIYWYVSREGVKSLSPEYFEKVLKMALEHPENKFTEEQIRAAVKQFIEEEESVEQAREVQLRETPELGKQS